MKKLSKSMGLALFLSAGVCFAASPWPASPALAQSADQEDPSELAKEGLDRMLRAIELMIEMIPQYDLPEVLPNGDILIRRINPPHGDETQDDPPLMDDETDT
ncbi:MAG: hypothetical protein AAF530_17510 [Pseudomonadota bacterium]